MSEEQKQLPVSALVHPEVLAHFAVILHNMTAKWPYRELELTDDVLVKTKAVLDDWHGSLSKAMFDVKYPELAKDPDFDLWIPSGESLTDPIVYNHQTGLAEGCHNSRDPNW